MSSFGDSRFVLAAVAAVCAYLAYDARTKSSDASSGSMPRVPKTAVLSHGVHLHATDADRMLWGDEALGLLGRVPHAALAALELDAALLLFGTGASNRDGVIESEHCRRLLTDDPTRMIRAFPNIFSRFGDAKLRELANRTHIDTVSQNTRQELQEALQTAANAGVERLVIVSSPTHVVRALRDVVVMTDQLMETAKAKGERALFQRFQLLRQHLYASPSGVSYANSTPSMVQVFEPPHRPDVPDTGFAALTGRFWSVPAEQRGEFTAKLDALLKEFNA